MPDQNPLPFETGLTGELLRAIIEGSDDAIISKNLDGVITSWNKGAERIFGYTAEQTVGKSILMLIPPERHDEEPVILARLRAGQRIDHYETVRRRKDGTLIDVSLTVSPVKDASGKVVGASKIARDITVRKRLEAERAEHAVRLEQALAQRTLELTEAYEQARRTETMAILGAISSGIAHDLANLVLPLRLRLDLLLAEAPRLDPQVREHIETIAKHIQYVHELGERVRQYMHVATRADEHPLAGAELLSLERWRRDVGPFLRGVIPPGSGIALQCTVAGELPPLSLNKTGLTQAVYNLVQNSVKAMRKGAVGGTIAISARQTNSDVELSVEDDGPGMMPHVLARCLEPRYTTDADSGGSGLGLSLVKAFTEAAGGELRIHSPPSHARPPNRGTSVILRFPIPNDRHLRSAQRNQRSRAPLLKPPGARDRESLREPTP